MRKVTHLIIHTAFFSVLTGFNIKAIASDFNLPFINAADLGNLYAGWAAAGNDASTAYTNPAGLVRIPNQQLVLAAVGLTGTTQFEGSTTPPNPPFPAQRGTASSFLHAFLPSFYYAAPISNNIVFGFGQTIPFGLGSDFSRDSIVRYAATKTQIGVLDFGPSLGFKLNNALSLGFGVDAERMTLTLNRMVGFPPFVPDSKSENNLSSWGYGWHGGVLYQFTPSTRAGISYNSSVTFRNTGSSTLTSSFIPGGEIRSNHLTSTFTLPSLAQLSIYHDFDPRWAIMGTIFYTNWSILKEITLKNIATPAGNITSTTPFNYHNTFDYAGGVTYKANEKWLFRTGLELLQTPTNNHDRIVNDPVGGATIVSVGARYQQNRQLIYDLGYAHSFFRQMKINHITSFNTEIGHSNTNTNIFGAQLTWNFV